MMEEGTEGLFLYSDCRWLEGRQRAVSSGIDILLRKKENENTRGIKNPV